MGPDSVAADAPQSAVANFEVGGAFLKNDSAGGVVAHLGVLRSRILHLNVINTDGGGAADQNRESVYPGELKLLDFKALHAIEPHSVVLVIHAEGIFGRRHFKRLSDHLLIALDGDIAQRNVACALACNDRAAVKI